MIFMNIIFKAKTDLPGCKKGREVVGVIGHHSYKYVDTGDTCFYDCVNEPKFFEEVKPPKYIIDDLVILKKTCIVPLCNIMGEKTSKHFTLPAFTEFAIKYERSVKDKIYVVLNFNNKYYLISETFISKPEVYYYVSSTGITHKAWKNKDKKVDAYRKDVGNMHNIKEDAEKYKEFLASCNEKH